MMFNQEGGMMTNKDGEILRQWKWPGAGKLDNPVIIEVNKCITVRISGRFAVCLVYKYNHESVRLSLSPVRGVAVPQLEQLGQILTEVKLSSKSIKGFSRMHSQILKEEEEHKPLNTEETQIPGIPAGELSHIKDVSATRELRKIRRKIKNILEDWMEYYRRAFGISSPHIQKPSTFPQRGRRRNMQLAGAPLDLRIKQGEEKSNSSEAPVMDNSLPFPSAPGRIHLTHDVSSGSCSSPFIKHHFQNKSAIHDFLQFK
ncbi:uncharacterized protein LOC134403509 [Elgaria multicarinata webbii]|uniref:uncharacterized protein LOC134403509 n=1 Tax=Elgaria multicarinata webbii TaxID=159646 RepID=UPI002FCD11C6